ncbi:uncharacterized protein H6S33_000952 [Morchella sextelata]|uniref:uncharacterized protein n=1 Tax=Morchella sextelata TaxID=1174677 RepID=UPI001D04DEBD|nr:uncharacterized protein H6S33_000952 [Morchella sextelata]KAH0615316.1 hypothetical protein H6S33_000952 [Morchella sextelata]
MHHSESGENHAFDALGLCSDIQYNEFLDLVDDTNARNDRGDQKNADFGEFDELKTTMLRSPPAGLDSANQCANSCGSSAGPDDQHARRKESWPPVLPVVAHPPSPPSASLLAPQAVPVWGVGVAPTKTMHMRIPARYKGKGQGLAGLSGIDADLLDPLVRIPASCNRRASTTLLSSCFPSSSSSPSSSFPPANFSAIPTTSVENTILPEGPKTNTRTLRHRKSHRDLHSARRAQFTELIKMNNVQQNSIPSNNPTFDEMIQYLPTQNSLQSLGQMTSDIPRYTPSHSSSRVSSSRPEYSRASFSLSAENLHTPQYEQVTLARPHSMSSLQTGPFCSEASAVQLAFRRASNPSSSSLEIYEGLYTPQPRQYTIDDQYNMVENSMDPQPLDPSIGLRMSTESPIIESDTPQGWWGEDKVNILEESWPNSHLSGVTSEHFSDLSNGTIRHHTNGNSHRPTYSPMLYRQPPSPSFDEEEGGIFAHSIKRPASSCSSIPSPPESELYYPSQLPTPEIGYSLTPSLNQSGFGGNYLPSSSSIDPTARRPSLHQTPSPPSSHTFATSAAAAAIAASSKTSKTISKSISRPGSSRRKASSGSIRSQAKSSGTSHSSQSNDGIRSFVNYTPNDATRILSGVAPSGSSKTKARREREAQEKRRKLSEAAAAAVVAAGGDASALAQVDLLGC